jgi:hypothetical protein
VAGAALGGIEIGAKVLEMWCMGRVSDPEWKRDFDVRYNPT